MKPLCDTNVSPAREIRVKLHPLMAIDTVHKGIRNDPMIKPVTGLCLADQVGVYRLAQSRSQIVTGQVGENVASKLGPDHSRRL